MSLFALINRGQYPAPVEQEFDHAAAAVTAWGTQDHNDDGTHATINGTGPIYERGRTAAAMGEWTSIANTTAFGAAGTTFTTSGTPIVRYRVIGTSLLVAFDVSGSLGGTATSVSLTLTTVNPLYTVDGTQVQGPCLATTSSTQQLASVTPAASTTNARQIVLTVALVSGSFASGTVRVSGQIELQVAG